MKYIILISVSILLTNCKKDDKSITNIKGNEINDIVKTIIKEERLNILKDSSKTYLFCEDLLKLNVYISDNNQNALPPPPDQNCTEIHNILIPKINNHKFCDSKDSLYIIQQNFDVKEFKISNQIIEQIHSTKYLKEDEKRKKGNFYEMSIPIFSRDNLKAYVELNRYCGHLCGNGISIYLVKINGKWRIIDKWRTWIS